MLQISSRVSIPFQEIELHAVRSQGPGGQNVNKVSMGIDAMNGSQYGLRGAGKRNVFNECNTPECCDGSVDFKRVSQVLCTLRAQAVII